MGSPGNVQISDRDEANIWAVADLGELRESSCSLPPGGSRTGPDRVTQDSGGWSHQKQSGMSRTLAPVCPALL